jgi:hypothetical protein
VSLGALLIAGAISITVFNIHAEEIVDANAESRLFLTGRPNSKQTFSDDGVPVSHSPRLKGGFVSPFYVVHYGMIHSETCRVSVDDTQYHWIHDSTASYWPQPPLTGMEYFRSLSEWVVNNIEVGPSGKAHLLYHFDCPYDGYPGVMLRAPWWSGLTDGYAIVLLMRAHDCFHDPRYLAAAEDLYRSVTASIAEGGSLLSLNGRPWIEEYVDPSAPVDEMSRVFNGMVYAYFGVASFEKYSEHILYSESLLSSIRVNARVFTLGPWSYYDAIGGQSNIKYHNVNLALIEDRRIYSHELEGLVQDWRLGRQWPAVYFVIFGPNSPAKFHFILSWFIAWISMFAAMIALAWTVGPVMHRSNPNDDS